MKRSSIPSVDLNLFRSSNPQDKNEFVQAIGSAYSDIGFVAIDNHGIDYELIDELYRQMEEFFGLDIETKRKYENVFGGQRGYTSFGKEHAKDSNKGDLKEFWHFGQILKEDDPLRAEYPDNVLVDEVGIADQIEHGLQHDVDQELANQGAKVGGAKVFLRQ